jgi:hypothetical protein
MDEELIQLIGGRAERPGEGRLASRCRRIAAYIDAPRSRVCALASTRRIPAATARR